jgi:hypothetical protein
MFISEVQNKNALQRTLMSHRTMTDSAQWPVGAVIGMVGAHSFMGVRIQTKT